MRTMSLIMLTVVVGTSATSAEAAGQHRTGNRLPSSGYYGGVSMFNFTPQYSNPCADYLNAQANLLRAQSDARLKSAQAAVEFEKWQALSIENHKKAVDTRRALQDEWQARRLENLSRNKPRPESLAEFARRDAPQPLSSDDFHAASGAIEWPAELIHPRYAAQRTLIENLLKSGADRERIRAAVADLSGSVKDRINLVPVNEYVAARKFLDRLSVTPASSVSNVAIAKN